MSRRTRLSVLTALCAASVLAAGCGATTEKPQGQDDGGGGGGEQCTPGEVTEAPSPKPLVVDVPADDTLANMVPANFKADGKLVIATDATYPPNEFTLEGSDEIIGMDVDLGNAIGKVLGVETEFVNASFDGILAGLQAGRYELGMSSFTDTKEREQTVDFATYFEAGTSTMVGKCNPKGIKSIEDLCGKTVGAENGTTQLDQLTKPDAEGSVVKACQDAGKEPPKSQGFPKQTDVNAALQAKRIDAYLADTPGRGLRGEDDRQRVREGRRGHRRRAVRHRHPQDRQGDEGGRAGRRAAAHQRRQLPEDPGQLGSRGRHQGIPDQRRDLLSHDRQS